MVDVQSPPNYVTVSSMPGYIKLFPAAEITPLASACALGDFDRVQAIFKSYLLNRSAEDQKLYELWPALLEAVSHVRTQVVSYLLGQGVPLASVHIDQAIKVQSPAIFDAFLQHGWDINNPLIETQPPALA
jgi:hypothetical protein